MSANGDRIQGLMNEVYDEWRKDENRAKGKWEVAGGFSEAHHIAVLFGNFNYQVENGGLEQWIYNGYFHDDAEKMAVYLEKGAESDERCQKILDRVNKLDQYAQETGCDRYGNFYDPDDDGESGFIGDMINCEAFDTWYYEHCGKEDWWTTVCGIIDKTEDAQKNISTQIYETGADFFRDTAASHGSDEAFGICGRYLDMQMKSEQLEDEHQFCRELFAAIYEASVESADPSKLVYPYDMDKANDRLEASYFHKSSSRNGECARAIDTIISASRFAEYRYNLDLAAMKAVHDFGFARVNLVLANHIQRHESDGRLSSGNKDWARKISITEHSCVGAYLNAHPVLIEDFANHVRKLYDSLDADRLALPGRPESGESVKGYEIIRAIEFSSERGFAIGLSPTAPTTFVTWQYTVENGQRDYYWGNYADTISSAADNYIARIIVHMDNSAVKEVRRTLAASAPEPAAREGKPSVLEQLRDAKKAPKPPRQEKTHKQLKRHNDNEI